MPTLLADYHDERAAFNNLLQSECESRILLFRGASGTGKTTLLDHCIQEANKTTSCVNINLKGGANTVAEILRRTASRLGEAKLTVFNERLSEIEGKKSVKIDKNWLAGVGNRIDVTLQTSTDRAQLSVTLTEALFADLSGMRQNTIFVMDTYEHAITEVQDWLGGPFLARVEQVKNVRALIAGQTVPDATNIEWGYCSTVKELYGVPEAKHWLPIVQAMNRTIPFDDPLTWLSGVCHALDGRPKNIMQIIEGLPKAKND